MLQIKSPFLPSLPPFLLRSLTHILPPCLLQSHGQITRVCVCSQPFLWTAAALQTSKWSEICKGTISVQWICPFPCSVKSLLSLTIVQVWKISSSVLRRDSLVLYTWNSNVCNNTIRQEGQSFSYLPLQLWDATDQDRKLVFPGILSSPFFFPFCHR